MGAAASLAYQHKTEQHSSEQQPTVWQRSTDSSHYYYFSCCCCKWQRVYTEARPEAATVAASVLCTRKLSLSCIKASLQTLMEISHEPGYVVLSLLLLLLLLLLRRF